MSDIVLVAVVIGLAVAFGVILVGFMACYSILKQIGRIRDFDHALLLAEFAKIREHLVVQADNVVKGMRQVQERAMEASMVRDQAIEDMRRENLKALRLLANAVRGRYEKPSVKDEEE